MKKFHTMPFFWAARLVRLILTLSVAISPIFAPVSSASASSAGEVHTYAVDDFDSLSIDQRLLLVSLQGLVNRDGPNLWLRSGAGQSPGLPLWEQTFPQLRTMTHISYREALQRFAANPWVVGLVVVDPALEETYNVATNLAGQQQLAIVTPATLGDVSLPVRQDLRGRYRDESEAFAANLALFATANHDIALKALHWSGNNYLYGAPERGRDLAIQRRYFTFSKSTLDSDLLDFYRGPLDEVRTFYGVAEDENLDVYRSSQAGKVWLGMGLQLQYNLSFFDMLRGDPNFVYRQPALNFTPVTRAPGSDEVRIAFVMTEGDNPFFVINQMRTNWNDPNHGLVPIGWTIAPRMLDLAPAVLQYFYATATPNDYFIAGVSGVAYYQVNAMDFNRYPELLQTETPQTLRQLDIRMIRNFGDWLGTQMSFFDRLQQTATVYPELLGWIEGHGVPLPKNPSEPHYERTMPVQIDNRYLDFPYSAWCDSDADVPRVVDEISTYITSHPERPLSVLVGMDQKASSPSTVRAIMTQLGVQYDYVRPDVLFRSRPTIVTGVATPQVGHDSALFTWTTDELASGELVLTEPQGTRTVQELDKAVKNHQLTVGKLQPDTNYSYYVVARDEDGNVTHSEDHTFKTATTTPSTSEVNPFVAGGLLLIICILLLLMFWSSAYSSDAVKRSA